MDPDQTGEAFDDELLADEYPPDEPLGAEAQDDDDNPLAAALRKAMQGR